MLQLLQRFFLSAFNALCASFGGFKLSDFDHFLLAVAKFLIQVQRRRVAVSQHRHAQAQLPLTPRSPPREIRQRVPLVPNLVRLRQVHRGEIYVHASDHHVLADSRLIAHVHHHVTRLQLILCHLDSIKIKQLIPQRRRRLLLDHRPSLLRFEPRALQLHLAHHVRQPIGVHRLRLQPKAHQRLQQAERLYRLQVFRLHQAHGDAVRARGRRVSRGRLQFLSIDDRRFVAPQPPHGAGRARAAADARRARVRVLPSARDRRARARRGGVCGR